MRKKDDYKTKSLFNSTSNEVGTLLVNHVKKKVSEIMKTDYMYPQPEIFCPFHVSTSIFSLWVQELNFPVTRL